MKNKLQSLVIALIAFMTAISAVAQDKISSLAQISAVYQSQGDMMTLNSGGYPLRVAIGSTGQVLTVSGGIPAWSSSPAVGGLSSAGSIVLGVQGDANRIFTLDGASDTALTFKFGDGTVSAQTFSIASATADAADSGSLCLASGGDCLNTRGARVEAYGNENASAGALIMQAGNNASGDVILGTSGTNGKIRLESGAAIPNMTILGTVATLLNTKFGDTTASQVEYITMGTSDAADTSRMVVTAGGGTVIDGSRGGGIDLYGNENAGAGKVDITMGATGNLRVIGNNGGSVVLTVEGDADGGVVINTGRLDFANAASTIKAGATSIQFNNNANSVANLKINDAGDVHLGAAKDLTFDVGLATISLQEATAGTACSGTLTANGATPVVTSTTCATTGSRIFLQRTSAETGTVNCWISAISNGVSFSVTSEAADTGTYNWVIFHEAP